MFKRFIAAFAFFLAGSALAANPQVELKTNMGDMTLELYPEKAPETVKNFLEYVGAGQYDGTVFHRVIDGFMIQGGGFDLKLEQKPTRAPVKNEADNGLKNDKFTIAMARTGDPHSATAQFFINVSDNVFLNHRGKNMQGWGYCVFGKVVKGDDVAMKISKLQTGGMGPFPTDVPVKPVVIQSAKLVEAAKDKVPAAPKGK